MAARISNGLLNINMSKPVKIKITVDYTVLVRDAIVFLLKQSFSCRFFFSLFGGL